MAEALSSREGVGGSVHGFDAGDGLEVAGIGHDGGELFELFQLGSHERALSYGSVDITRGPAATQGREGVSSGPSGNNLKTAV